MPLNQQFFKFAAVGAYGVIVNIGLLELLVNTGTPPIAANITSVGISIITNFILNDLWTFRENTTGTSKYQRLIRFIGISLVGMGINSIVFTGLVLCGFYYLYASLSAIAITFAWNYIMNKKVTWG